jgi:hypothetical protein
VSRPSSRAAKATVAILAAALLLALGAQSAGAAPVAPFDLWVVFHENHTITVAFDDGTPVGSLTGAGAAIAPGSYTLHFEDSVGVEGPDFDLRGPGVSLQEDWFFGEAPSATHRVVFQPGSTYTWRNVEQPSAIFTFTTTTGASNPAPSPTPGSGPSGSTKTSTSKDVVGSQRVVFRGTLSGNVSTAGKLTLKYLGKAVGSLRTGSYKLSVLDETAKAAFYLQRLGAAEPTKVSSTGYVGKHSVTLTLKAGQWFFFSTPGKKSYFIVHN